MKTVGVFFDDPGENDYPFNIELYRTVYRQLGRVIADNGARLHIVRSPNSYLGNNTFSHCWAFDGVWFKAFDKPKRMDVLWIKGALFSDPEARQVNPFALNAICANKWSCYKLFPHLYKKTLLVERAGISLELSKNS